MRYVFTVILCLCVSACNYQDDPRSTTQKQQSASNAIDLGWECFHNSDYQTAMRQFRTAIRLDSSDASGYYGIAYIYSVQGNLDEAIRYYRFTLERDQTYPYTFANLGYALLQKRQFDEALKMLDHALQLMPDCGEAHLSYANYYAFKKQWGKAQKSANKAIEYGQVIHPELKKCYKIMA